MSTNTTSTLIHSALRPAAGAPLGEAALSDRQRVAILLQASSLLAHLQLGSRSLASGWEGCHVDADGLLSGLESHLGAGEDMPQRQLSLLATLLFRAEEQVAGRGEARRIVRQLMSGWQQQLTTMQPDEAVQQILDLASFLWLPSFASSRRCLAAEHRNEGVTRLWVAGPEWFRGPLLESSSSLSELEERLQADEAELLWRGSKRSASNMASRGRWRAAVAAWRGKPRKSAEDRIDFAHALLAVGRFSEALQELRRLRRPSARVLRARCLTRLGELRRAKREISQLESSGLSGNALLETASAAIRLFGNLGDEEGAERWVSRAFAGAVSEAERCRAHLLACGAAWDRGDREAMRRSLDKAREGRELGDLGWRWHKANALEAIARGEGEAAVASLGQALITERKRMTPIEAGDVWNEMALARSQVGDLAGAERALLHTLRLHREAEGPRKTTLALFNLAEVRLRRGKLEGVLDILEQSTKENRKSGNWRAMVHDVELWARSDLVRGRPSAAEERLSQALDHFGSRGVTWRQGQLRVLLARAVGWLDRAEDAAEHLAAGGDAVVADLEPEERPALWALAGDRERALESIPSTPAAGAWRALLTAREPTPEEWRAAEGVGDYRFARMVFDAEKVVPGSVPRHLVRRAAVTLRAAGAGALAEQLEAVDVGVWEALERFLDEDWRDAGAIARLLTEAGYGEVRLAVRHGSDEEVLVDGAGGSSELVVPAEQGELVARSSWIDPVLRILLRLVARDMDAAPRSRATADAGRRGRSGIVGESPALRTSLEKLAHLAPGRVPVLLVGETGTGKELAARRIHRLSDRAEGPFIPLNCAAVSEELLMSDLFGHVRGAYTGAVRDRIGVFEAARAGTVFLDEIGDLPLRAQGFLLRVLQEGEVRRVGESLARSTDVRVVTATHRDLERMVRDGDFRADLFYRLRVAKVELPPLRERGDDLMLLVQHFLERMSPLAPPTVSSRARQALRSHDWPGNVRELENVLSVALAMAGKAARLEPRHLDLPYSGVGVAEGYHELVLNFRRRLVRDALVECGGNRAEAARRLGLTRQALSYLVRKLGIDE